MTDHEELRKGKVKYVCLVYLDERKVSMLRRKIYATLTVSAPMMRHC